MGEWSRNKRKMNKKASNRRPKLFTIIFFFLFMSAFPFRVADVSNDRPWRSIPHRSSFFFLLSSSWTVLSKNGEWEIAIVAADRLDRLVLEKFRGVKARESSPGGEWKRERERERTHALYTVDNFLLTASPVFRFVASLFESTRSWWQGYEKITFFIFLFFSIVFTF